MPAILVIGDVMRDIVVRPEGPIATGADTRAGIRVLPGGSAANAAAWLAAEGVDVRMAARVGRDDRDMLAARLAGEGVDARLGADDVLPTGMLVTLVAADGERSVLTDRGANEALAAADLPDTLLDGIDLVSISGYALFAPGPRAAVLGLLATARERGIPFAIDPSTHSWLAEAGAAAFLDWTAGARFILANDSEAAVLTGTTNAAEQCDRLLERYAIVAIKRGSDGALTAERESGARVSVPAPAVEVVDTSGAGDAFLAGFLAAYLRGEGLAAAAERGAERGSRAVTHLGGRPAR